MRRLFRFFERPEYFFRPSQFTRRLMKWHYRSKETVALAWGLPVKINLNCTTGIDILNIGVFDRVVPEVISRLLDPGEMGLDIGANVGQNTSIMALVAGQNGKVIAFEPHPQLIETLLFNVREWNDFALSPIEIVQQGISEQSGQTVLYESSEFDGNMGIASIEKPADIISEYKIQMTTLDDFLPADSKVGLAKLDVEGHEMAVLNGARKLLAEHRLRDLIFEDFSEQPGELAIKLEEFGYTVFAMLSQWAKPGLQPLREFDPRQQNFFSSNYLATLDPKRAQKRMQTWGWKCLHTRARKK